MNNQIRVSLMISYLANLLFFAGAVGVSVNVGELRQEIAALRQSIEAAQHEREEAVVGATPRSPDWSHVRAEYVTEHPVCEACGTKENLNVHHVVPFHTNPDLELDPSNLITLCREHHWTIGHDEDGPDGPKRPNWSAANKNVRADAARMRKKLKP